MYNLTEQRTAGSEIPNERVEYCLPRRKITEESINMISVSQHETNFTNFGNSPEISIIYVYHLIIQID